MKKGPIGVWFSVALAIFLLSLWTGSHLGSAAARYWYRHKRQAQIKTDGPERAHLESVLSDLNTVPPLELFAPLYANDKELGKKYLLNDVGVLESIEQKSNRQEIKPVIDFNLGRACVYAAMIEEQTGDKEQADRHMRSAQPLFQSLGWSDYSEATLKTVARRQLHQWNLHLATEESGK